MTKKRFLSVLYAILLTLVLILASACSFFAEEDRREIENIYYLEATQDDREGLMIVIEYVGDEYPDSMFFVPNGEEGKEGNGISDVQAELVEDGSKIKITVNYTDKTRDPSEFTFENEVFPTDFKTELDEETGDWTVTITLSNGEEQTFTLHNGKDGDSVVEITTETDDDGTTWIVFTMASTDEEGNPVEHRFPMPEGDVGEQGVGIKDIYVDTYFTGQDPYNIHLVITLTDDSRFEVQIPKVNNWTVSDTGEVPTGGNVGDFVFDKKSYKIYYMDYSGWTLIMDLSEQRSDEHTVKFIADGVAVGGPQTVIHGNYFLASGLEVPTTAKEGFTFAGWYTAPCDPATGEVPPTAGLFTDLTPVLCDLVLYARFIPNP